MELLSPTYVAFIAIAAFLFHACAERWRSWFLGAVSLIFYALFSVVSAAILVVLTLLSWAVARRTSASPGSRRSKAELAATVAVAVSYLVFLKAVPVWGIHPRTVLSRFLIGFGTSYYVFKLIGYLLDVYWQRHAPETFGRLLAVSAFFPQLPAGPIQRVGEFGWVKNAEELPALMSQGFRRILLGFVKKMAFADPLGAMVAFIAANPHEFAAQQWVLFYLYPVQLYADFSALTDIAVGAAALFGIRSPENFALPFFAVNIVDFWRRWHITLTQWLTDYVFTPLRMATRDLGDWGLALSLTLNMTLIGLWHGFNSGFLAFGLIHAGYLIADSLTAPSRRRFYKKHRTVSSITDLAGPVFTFHLIAIPLVFFRDGTLSGSLYTLRQFFLGVAHPTSSLATLMYNFGRLRSVCACFALAGLIALDTATLGRLRQWAPWRAVARFTDLPRPLRWACYCAAILGAILLHRQGGQFIYVQF